MTREPSVYAGHSVVFATMHGKERLAQRAFAQRLSASVIAPDHLDTDLLGTFSGEVPRTLSPRAAAAVKARLGMQVTGLPYALASEGSFHSALFGVDNTEILLFLDTVRGLELVERSVETSPVRPARTVESVDDALDFAAAIGFPAQGLLVQERHGHTVLTHTEVTSTAVLTELVARALDTGAAVAALPDHRAHRSPTRADRIRALCDRMARRLATACPACESPGFGLIDVESGVPCSLCGLATTAIAADIHGCAVCDERERRPRVERYANPAECDNCNP